MGFGDWLKQSFGKVNDWWNQNVSQPWHKAIEWTNQKIIQPGAQVLKNVPIIGGIAEGAGTIGNAVESLSAQNVGKKPRDIGSTVSDLGNIVKGGAQIYGSAKRVRTA